MIFFKDKRIHFIGIGGIGMSAIAEQLSAMGICVQGSNNVENNNTKRLQEKGIPIYIGQNDVRVLDNVDAVIITSAIHEDNLELQEAIKRGIPVGHRSEMLAELMRMKKGIAIAGTHGKTTTSSLISHLMKVGGFDPSCIIGGVMNNYDTNSILGKSDWMVVEADESDGSFLRLNKMVSVITNMDAEHLDFYKSVERMNEAYLLFMQSTAFFGFNVVCTDHPVVKEWSQKVAHRQVISYGFNEDAFIRAVNIKAEFGKLYFDILKGKTLYKDFMLPLFGRHNILNALAGFAVVDALGMSVDKIKEGLSTFRGVQRRLSLCGKYNEIPIYDDYAHHPEEIKATLKALKSVMDKTSRIFTIFQPHRYTRLADLMGAFASAFDLADFVYVMDVYSAGEQPIAGICKEKLIEELQRQGHKNVFALEDKEVFTQHLLDNIQKGDIIVGLGAGDISKMVHCLPEMMKKESQNV